MKLSAVFDRVLWLCATVSSQVVHRGLDRRVPRGRDIGVAWTPLLVLRLQAIQWEPRGSSVPSVPLLGLVTRQTEVESTE